MNIVDIVIDVVVVVAVTVVVLGSLSPEQVMNTTFLDSGKSEKNEK